MRGVEGNYGVTREQYLTFDKNEFSFNITLISRDQR